MQMTLKDKVVVTEAGKVLGEVRDVEVVWPDMRVVQLGVRRSLFGGWLLISADSIVKIEGERIIVRDALVSEKAKVSEQVERVVDQGGMKVPVATRE